MEYNTETRDRHKHSQCYNAEIQWRESGIQNSSPMSSHMLGLNIILDFVVNKGKSELLQTFFDSVKICGRYVAGPMMLPENRDG